MRAVEMVKHTTGFHVISVSPAPDLARFHTHTHRHARVDDRRIGETHDKQMTTAALRASCHVGEHSSDVDSEANLSVMNYF